MQEIKAVIFDLNGVFVISRKLSERFLSDFGVPEEVFLPALKGVMGKVRRPNAENAYSYWKPYLEKWCVDLSEKQFFTYWFSAENENQAMVDIAKALKRKNILLFILSNNLKERTKYYQDKFPFLGTLFTKTYYSWQTGYIKPDVRAYELLLRENDLRPEECLYFDDSETNVTQASEIGIRSYLFTGSEDVKAKLSSL
jgi:putative hydrolase of the HAD superfamily